MTEIKTFFQRLRDGHWDLANAAHAPSVDETMLHRFLALDLPEETAKLVALLIVSCPKWRDRYATILLDDHTEEDTNV